MAWGRDGYCLQHYSVAFKWVSNKDQPELLIQGRMVDAFMGLRPNSDPIL